MKILKSKNDKKLNVKYWKEDRLIFVNFKFGFNDEF